MPPSWQRQINSGTGGLPVEREQEAVYRASFERMVALTGLLYRSGVPVVAGTDNIAGIELVRELELYVTAGIPPREVLRIATHSGAEVMKRGDRFGRIAPGYVADLMLVDGDPSVNISDLRRVRTVLRGDRLYDSAALYRSLGVKAVE
jgi:imidazolonepropionase-like amidohydrolase